MKKNFVLVTDKEWHNDLFDHVALDKNSNWTRIVSKTEFSEENLSALNPEYVFIPHWSHIISEQIFSKFNCVVFHMTDLPYGRGGSPLQNLIVRGHKETMISAIRVEAGIDTGPVYLKRPLSLEGTAREIFERSSLVIEEMIGEIIVNQIRPVPQTGNATVFKRRSKEDGNIKSLTETSTVFDYIRMLDCEGYPKAFVETDHLRFEFENASFIKNEIVIANVRITKK